MAGASSGIGAATAIAIASLGIDVVAVARHPDRLKEHGHFPSARSRLDLVTADVTDPAEVESVFSHTETAHGPVRFVVHSVGFEYRVGWYRDAAPGDILDAVSALIASPAMVIRRALRSMWGTAGSIGVISSGAANRATPGRALYSSSKVAVNRLVESVAAECKAGAGNIGVFAILPGRVDTPMQQRLMRTAQDAEPAFGLERFRSYEGVSSADEVGESIASLLQRPPAELNGQILRYQPEGWVSTNR